MGRITDKNRYFELSGERTSPTNVIRMFMADKNSVEVRTFDSDKGKPFLYLTCGKACIYKNFD
jgi:hypothetical protein